MKRVVLNIFYCLLLGTALSSCKSNVNQFDVRDFGAVGDSITLNHEYIQKAIDKCSEEGGGVVFLAEGIYKSGTILLKDNVELRIDKSATLLGSENPMDYTSIDPFIDATGQERGKCLIGATEAKNVSITGSGIVDGQGKTFLYDNIVKLMEREGINKNEVKDFTSNRPFLIRFVRSEDIRLVDINLRQPAAWTCHFYQCKKAHVEGVNIYSHAHHNNDGIDLDSSEEIVVKNCTIDAGDDAICFKTTSPVPTSNILVSDCKLKSEWGAIKFGTESMGDFRNITIKDCFIHGTRGGGLKILSVDGANISNIKISNITMEQVDMPIFIRLGERLRTYRNAPKQEVGSIDSVFISNVIAKTWSVNESRVQPPSGILITGTPNNKISNVQLKNIRITLPGEGTVAHSKVIVAEDEEKYPEFSFFGILPASGLFARHIETLSIDSLVINTQSKDERPPYIMTDVLKEEFGTLLFNNDQVNNQF